MSNIRIILIILVYLKNHGSERLVIQSFLGLLSDKIYSDLFYYRLLRVFVMGFILLLAHFELIFLFLLYYFSLVKFINNSEWIHQINHHLTFCLSFDNFPFAKSQSFLLFFLSLVISMLQE